jgi:hypothetical protein
MSKMKLTFGSFIVGQDEGKVTVLLEAASVGAAARRWRWRLRSTIRSC